MTPGATSAIRVAVVDDQPLLVSAFSALVGAQPDMEVVLEAVDGRQAVDRLIDSHCGADLVLMDLRMPVLDGVGAIRELRAAPAASSLRILVLTTFDDDDLVLAALGAGAHGFLLKDAESSPAAGPGWTRPSPAPSWPTSIQVPIGAPARALSWPRAPVRMPRGPRLRRRYRSVAPYPSSGRRRDPTSP